MAMENPPSSELSDDVLALTAKALAHPARVALVRTLATKPSCCGHLVRKLSSADLPLAQSTVSQHLRVLVDAGLVTRTQCGVESVFNLNVDALSAAISAMASLQPTNPPELPLDNAAVRDCIEKA